MSAAHLKELLALLLIGEGVVGTLYPERYTLLWATGPRPWREFIDWWAKRPGRLRLLCAAEAGVGLWLATRQFPPAEAAPQDFGSDGKGAGSRFESIRPNQALQPTAAS
jgi:hypothetical protein